jgi:L,D-peptidoglycan transpeptidase YkuD (ErfK/YbiS/YcfS/YnhG family)
LQCIQTQQKARWFNDVSYAAASWEQPWRLAFTSPYPGSMWCNYNRHPIYNQLALHRSLHFCPHSAGIKEVTRLDPIT